MHPDRDTNSTSERWPDRARERYRFLSAWLTAVCLLAQIVQPLCAAFRKESPIALIIEATGGEYQPMGTHTPLHARPGVLLFDGDVLSAANGSVRFLWCPEAA